MDNNEIYAEVGLLSTRIYNKLAESELERLESIYRYAPLEQASSNIRLLVLLPGKDCEQIQSYLEHVCLAAGSTHYEALSYTWGSPKQLRQKIIIDQSSFNVLENLNDALRALRLKDRNRVLWIDSICINQHDNEEKNHQVRQMGLIYSSAQQVISWLGLDSPGGLGSVAMDFLANPKLDVLSATNREVRIINSLKSLCSRAYWQRVWIVQEVGLAKKIILVCGQSQVPWERLDEVHQMLIHQVNALRTTKPYQSPKRVSPLAELLESRPMKLNAQRRNERVSQCLLFPLIKDCSEFQCQDKRDKIYGFLGLASDGINYDIDIEYSSSLIEVQLSVLRSVYSRKDVSIRPWIQGSNVVELCSLLGKLLGTSSASTSPLNHQLPTTMFTVPAYSICSIQNLTRPMWRGPPLTVCGEKMRNYWWQETSYPMFTWLSKSELNALPGDQSDQYEKRRKFQNVAAALQQIEPLDSKSVLKLKSDLSFAEEDERYRFYHTRISRCPRLQRYHNKLQSADHASYFECADSTIGLACPGARTNDIVCKFLGFEGAILIRPVDPEAITISRYNIVGKAMYPEVQINECQTRWIQARFGYTLADNAQRVFGSVGTMSEKEIDDELIDADKDIESMCNRDDNSNEMVPMLFHLDFATLRHLTGPMV